MHTIDKIYRDIILYSNHVREGKSVENLVIQDSNELLFARALVSYLKEGTYLPKTTRRFHSAYNLVNSYNVTSTREYLMENLGISNNTLYAVNRLVESSIADKFGNLLELWDNREFSKISDFMMMDVSIYEEAFEDIIEACNFELSSHLSASELDILGSKLKDLSDNEIEDYVNIVKMLKELEKLITRVNREVVKLEVLQRALVNNKVIPVPILEAIVSSNPITDLENDLV